MKKSVKYTDLLDKDLKDPEFAAAYLNAHLEDDGESQYEELLLLALGDIARAYGVANIAEKTKLGRESLYKALSSNGNPKLTTLISLLKVMGLKLSVSIDKNKAS
ncbi:MAG: putative addiction module antidote protein [Bdellovibrio sp.]|nr:putative addiction module antidote protein [Bdellovibrio sp.]